MPAVTMHDPGQWYAKAHPHSEKVKARALLLTRHRRLSGRRRLNPIWHSMKYRCYKPGNRAARWYYDKGILVCKEWHVFEAFYRWAMSAGYDDSLTLDRRDSRGHYCPENCRWITQQENTRRTHFRPRRVLSKHAYHTAK